jgi:FMN phosphatase YigB (HAD superfamily)
MTPEERAADVLDLFASGPSPLELERSRQNDIALIAADIRAAENDALERAAVVADGCWPGYPDAASAIRALKHKEP